MRPDTFGRYLMQVIEVVTFNCGSVSAGERLDRDRHVLDVLGATLGGDDDFPEAGRGVVRLRDGTRVGSDCVTHGAAAENGSDRTGQLRARVHVHPSVDLWLRK